VVPAAETCRPNMSKNESHLAPAFIKNAPAILADKSKNPKVAANSIYKFFNVKKPCLELGGNCWLLP
jgi:hypothetical protein